MCYFCRLKQKLTVPYVKILKCITPLILQYAYVFRNPKCKYVQCTQYTYVCLSIVSIGYYPIKNERLHQRLWARPVKLQVKCNYGSHQFNVFKSAHISGN